MQSFLRMAVFLNGYRLFLIEYFHKFFACDSLLIKEIMCKFVQLFDVVAEDLDRVEVRFLDEFLDLLIDTSRSFR